MTPRQYLLLSAILLFHANIVETARAADAKPHTSGGFTVAAEDGFDLWFDAWGAGPAILFLAREPSENRALAEALSDSYRVVLFEDRAYTMYQKALVEKADDPEVREKGAEHLAGRRLDWDLSNLDGFPMQLMISDLHRVADAAGIGDFVIGGYSGTGRMAALYAPHSERAIGLIVGGFHILDGHEFWIGYTSGSSSRILQDEDSSELDKQLVMYSRSIPDYEVGRDNEEAYGGMTGPRVVWIGSKDGAPSDDYMQRFVWEARIAERVRSHRKEYQRLGFSYFELEGMGHVDAYLAGDKAAPHVRAALEAAGYQ